MRPDISYLDQVTEEAEEDLIGMEEEKPKPKSKTLTEVRVEYTKRRNDENHFGPLTYAELSSVQNEEPWVVKKLIQMGVDGVILKSADTDEIKNALRSVLNGESYFCDEFNKIKKRLRLNGDTPDYHSLLTNREMDVLKAISMGMQTKEIAESLHVSVNTVESHRKSLFSKFEVRNAVELVLKAINNGIIHLDPNKNI